MEISSVASQALAMKEQLNSTQLGMAVLKQAADAEQMLVSMLDQNSQTIQAAQGAGPGGFSTYA